jgi:hypothetical protein
MRFAPTLVWTALLCPHSPAIAFYSSNKIAANLIPPFSLSREASMAWFLFTEAGITFPLQPSRSLALRCPARTSLRIGSRSIRSLHRAHIFFVPIRPAGY